ncbi:MAG: hypothetical protein WC836_00785 [Desulfobacula sp.]|jgi:hypothetical protein
MGKNRFHFFISGEEKEVLPGSELWELPLSGKRTGIDGNSQSGTVNRDAEITVGDYFSASCEVLSKDEFSILSTGLEAIFQKPVERIDIQKVSVFLEKHGAFYHPLKIKTELKNSQTCVFVLNGAVSNPGLSLIETEYSLILRLNKTFPKRYLPCVFGLDMLETKYGRAGFFLGEWFENYKEFHVTSGRDQNQIVIWESDGACLYLPEKVALPIYREAARILTYYYNIETFEQIYPWRHAAGDFVVKQEGSQFHVRLITVRGYSVLTEFGSGEADNKNYILPSLLVFFFNLTIKMRLDRLDGTGKDVMLGDEVIKATIRGFLEALDEKSKGYDYGDLKLSFISFIEGWGLEQITNILATIMESSDMNPAEKQLMMENIDTHCRIIHTFFKTL